MGSYGYYGSVEGVIPTPVNGSCNTPWQTGDTESSLLLIRAFGDWSEQCLNPNACNSYHLDNNNLSGILINNNLCNFPSET